MNKAKINTKINLAQKMIAGNQRLYCNPFPFRLLRFFFFQHIFIESEISEYGEQYVQFVEDITVGEKNFYDPDSRGRKIFK